MPPQKPIERPQSHARRHGYRGYYQTRKRPTESRRGHTEPRPKKRPRDPPGAAPPPEWVSFRSLFVLFRWELAGANFAELIFDFLKSPFCGFSENEKVYFLSRFLRRHQVAVHQPPRNQDNAVALLPGLLLHREGCSV